MQEVPQHVDKRLHTTPKPFRIQGQLLEDMWMFTFYCSGCSHSQ